MELAMETTPWSNFVECMINENRIKLLLDAVIDVNSWCFESLKLHSPTAARMWRAYSTTFLP